MTARGEALRPLAEIARWILENDGVRSEEAAMVAAELQAHATIADMRATAGRLCDAADLEDLAALAADEADWADDAADPLTVGELLCMPAPAPARLSPAAVGRVLSSYAWIRFVPSEGGMVTALRTLARCCTDRELHALIARSKSIVVSGLVERPTLYLAHVAQKRGGS